MSESKKKRKSKKTKKMKKESNDSPPELESSDEELDLTKDCHPISHYMNDRAEMVAQMFSVIKGSRLKAMLPPVIKDLDVEKLKLKCLDQLLGMSEKRIMSIIEGEILETSSESDESEESESEDSSDSSEKSSDTENLNKRKKADAEEGKADRSIKQEESTLPPEQQGKTLLEILELEMRARAIRALLNQGESEVKQQQQQQLPNTRRFFNPEPPSSAENIVDLTEDYPTVIKREPPTQQEQSFEDKVKKSQELKAARETERKKRLMAEQELRNKLIKKKSYRTRQQRMENIEPDVPPEPEAPSNDNSKNIVKEVQDDVIMEIYVKKEPAEIVIEDPEDGEVSSDEEPLQPVIKLEDDAQTAAADSLVEQSAIQGERILAVDEGEFISDINPEQDKPMETDSTLSVNNAEHEKLMAVDNKAITAEDKAEDPSRDESQVADSTESQTKQGQIYQTGAESLCCPLSVLTNAVQDNQLLSKYFAAKEQQETDNTNDNSTIGDPERESGILNVTDSSANQNTVSASERTREPLEIDDNASNVVIQVIQHVIASKDHVHQDNIDENHNPEVEGLQKKTDTCDILRDPDNSKEPDSNVKIIPSVFHADLTNDNVQVPENSSKETADQDFVQIEEEPSPGNPEQPDNTKVSNIFHIDLTTNEELVQKKSSNESVKHDSVQIEAEDDSTQPQQKPVETIELIEEDECNYTLVELEDSDDDVYIEEDSEGNPITDASDNTQEGQDDLESGSTWKSRWLNKDKVQRVFKSSKICALVRKRLKKKKAAANILKTADDTSNPPIDIITNTVTPVAEPLPLVEPVIIEGSVDEYERIFGKKVILTEDIVKDVLDEVIERVENGITAENVINCMMKTIEQECTSTPESE